MQENRQQVEVFVHQCVAYYFKNRMDNIDTRDEDVMLRSLELRSIMFSFTLVLGILESADGLNRAVNNAMLVTPNSPHAPKNATGRPEQEHSSLLYNWSWLIMPLKLITCLDIIVRIFSVLKSLPATLSSRDRLFAKLKDRRIQFGLKHWAGLSVVLSLFLPLDSNFPTIRTAWGPVFAYLAVATAFTEKSP
ncbi:hypothetical protein WJX73_001467 [Symbiochloris irregularis]|uniref:Uncharacterized protein n=1 Tax=Symbiochloris irregularis TaxID=706552 RepID=A0AAW1PFY5_9CHLO